MNSGRKSTTLAFTESRPPAAASDGSQVVTAMVARDGNHCPSRNAGALEDVARAGPRFLPEGHEITPDEGDYAP
jgi:hypothetical protein